MPKIVKLNKNKLFQYNKGIVRRKEKLRKLQIWLNLKKNITNL
jgi:hypothetical protein